MHKLSKYLFFILMLLLAFAFLQQNLGIIKMPKLHGDVKKIEFPLFTPKTWFNEEFQSNSEKYFGQNFGFSNWFIKIQNQIQYTFFKKAKANGVIIGKDEYLYEKSYIDAYYGNDYLGDSILNDVYYKLSIINDSLSKLNKHLLIVFAPGKASFFPEYIPEDLKSDMKTTNLQKAVEIVDSLNLDYIDMSSWFIAMKDTVSYPLYPKTGIHWSYYGVKLAVDSLNSYFKTKYNYQFGNFLWEPIEWNSSLKSPDRDIELGMNLVFPLKNKPMAYTKFNSKLSENSPRSIVVADSYYWQLFNMGYSTKVFKDSQFWFYNKQVYPSGGEKLTVSDINITSEIKNSDVVILLTTEPVLKRKYWDFADMILYDLQNPDAEKIKAIEINAIKRSIKRQTKWFDMIKQKALDRNISVDSMLFMDAEFVYKQKHSLLK